MKIAHKIGLGLSLIHGFLFFAALNQGSGILFDLYFASIYLPLMPFAYIGLPVTDGFTGWGWSGPSFLGYVLGIMFWLGVWFLVGHLIEHVIERVKNA